MGIGVIGMSIAGCASKSETNSEKSEEKKTTIMNQQREDFEQRAFVLKSGYNPDTLFIYGGEGGGSSDDASYIAVLTWNINEPFFRHNHLIRPGDQAYEHHNQQFKAYREKNQRNDWLVAGLEERIIRIQEGDSTASIPDTITVFACSTLSDSLGYALYITKGFGRYEPPRHHKVIRPGDQEYDAYNNQLQSLRPKRDPKDYNLSGWKHF